MTHPTITPESHAIVSLLRDRRTYAVPRTQKTLADCHFVSDQYGQRFVRREVCGDVRSVAIDHVREYANGRRYGIIRLSAATAARLA